MANFSMNSDIIMNNSNEIADYCEMALNVADKLKDEYFFTVPASYDESLMDEHLDKIINSYDYISFAMGILRNAIKMVNDCNKVVMRNAVCIYQNSDVTQRQ